MIKNKNFTALMSNSRYLEITFLFLFLVSGFSGLIYESVWTHYLKLIFGHAAYAQSLVLSIFMGGLAVGAYLISHFTNRIKNPLLIYALIEILIGLFALFFHDIFIFTQNILFNQLAPNTDSGFIFNLIKWLLGILLILPQSILLGSTFPLISSGLLKLSQIGFGKKISLLYFSNSFGAAIGALVSGFILIKTFGLPGTMVTAGLINIGIGFITLLIIKNVSIKTQPQQTISQILIRNKFYYLMLCTAFFTGVASFFYEIAWIRMLTLVLGATTHAFELMISAFILGLALGSLWIKRRIDKLTSPVMVLGYIQLLMATFALLTLTFYDSLFDIMEYIFKVINRTEESYGIYIFTNHILALIIMLPATFFAGMTLPLVTHILFDKHRNEKVIGQVYAINTAGAIIGVVIAMNFLLPLTGTKGLVSLGGLIDLTIGLTLLGYLYYKNDTRKIKLQLILSCLFSLALFQTIYFSSSFDPLKTASGVFRTGKAKFDDKTKILFHKDGKLSTVDIIETTDGQVIISNNGKPDAGVRLYGSVGGIDEVTMILAGILPMTINPEIKNVANIGMGSGQTAQALLTNKNIIQVDTLEIEQGVIEALPFFSVHSQLPRFDNRSNITIEDAKTFFSSSMNKYDLIVSEPPNLWVSGVSSLFTTEFYSHIKKKLTHDGLFTQWIHLYEIDIKSISSIFNALSNNFNNYVLFNTDERNILIVASDNLNLNNLNNSVLSGNKTQKLLRRIKISSIDSIQARYIGNKHLLDPLFKSIETRIASDFYPTLPYDAAKSFFLKDSSVSLTSLHNFPIPINQLLSSSYPDNTLNTLNEIFFKKSTNINIAKSILNDFTADRKFNNPIYNQQLHYSLKLLSNQLFQCSSQAQKKNINNNIIIDSTYELVAATSPYLGNNDLIKLWKKIQNAPCYKHIKGTTKDWIKLYKDVATHNFEPALKSALHLFKSQKLNQNTKIKKYLFSSILISATKTNKTELAQNFWLQYSKVIYKSAQEVPMSLRLLYAHFKN